MMTLVYIILALAGIIAIQIVLLKFTFKKLKNAQKEVQRMTASFEQVRKRVESLQKAQAKNKKITEEAHEKREELKNTSDASLVTRANSLFDDELRDDKSNRSGRN